jgi:glycosyltransferase involved in cell wall biosynthesis
MKNGINPVNFTPDGRKGLRICFLSSYPPNQARLSEYAKNLVSELARRPSIDQITVLADRAPNSKTRYLSADSKIEIIRLWNHDNPLSILSIMFQILRLKPDLVHFSVGFQSFGKSRLSNFSGLSLILLCRIFGVKSLVLLHNLAPLIDLKKLNVKPTFINKTGILVATKLILSATSVVVMVKQYADYLRNNFSKKQILFFPHGNLSHSCSIADPPEKVVLLFGHIGPSKGLSTMLNAFDIIKKERDDVKLIIAGDSHPNFPGYIDEYIEKAPSKVTFTGYVPEIDLCNVFGMADVVVTPYSLATGTSGVFHLACGYGKPIVSSNLPEIRELVSDGASATLVPPGNPNVLAEAVLEILNDQELAAKMGKQNLNFARKEPLNKIAKDYEETYHKILKINGLLNLSSLS